MGINPVGVAQPQPKSNLEKTAIVASIGAAAGAILVGGADYFTQKAILQNPEPFIADIKTNMQRLKASGESMLDGLLAKANENALQKIKEMTDKGKVDLKTVGKAALIGSAVTALFAGAVYFIGKSIIDAFKGDK